MITSSSTKGSSITSSLFIPKTSSDRFSSFVISAIEIFSSMFDNAGISTVSLKKLLSLCESVLFTIISGDSSKTSSTSVELKTSPKTSSLLSTTGVWSVCCCFSSSSKIFLIEDKIPSISFSCILSDIII